MTGAELFFDGRAKFQFENRFDPMTETNNPVWLHQSGLFVSVIGSKRFSN